MHKEIRRILEISYKYKLSHIGSCLTALPIIEGIYEKKKPQEKFVLSSGHAHLAHLVIMEKYGLTNAEQALQYGIHCDRRAGCDVSTGSLGLGLPIAVGLAVANRRKNVYCLISDGECAEGSIWEALRLKRQLELDNLKLYLNRNGWAAYTETASYWLPQNGCIQVHTSVEQFPFLKGLDAHYYVLTQKDYETYVC